jgi:hypothetical protein
MAKLEDSVFVKSNTEIEISKGADVTITGCSFHGSNTLFSSPGTQPTPKGGKSIFSKCWTFFREEFPRLSVAVVSGWLTK